jgi:hypothetical protein
MPLNAPPRVLPPPSAPRPFANSYAWKLVFADGWAIASLIFLLIGVIFTLTGSGLTLGIITAFVGLPFLLLGLGFLAAGGIIFQQRFQKARTILNVLREGEAAPGQITSVGMNRSVRINGQHPWIIRYSYQVAGNNYEGQVATLTQPHPALKAGRDAYVLYLPNRPENNALYPHP